MIYADNAATTKLSRAALDAMLPFLKENYGNPSSIHSHGTKAAQALVSARESISSILGCTPSELTFTSGGSESDNQALLSAAAIGKKQGRMHIISDPIEHHAVLHTLDRLESEGFTVTYLPVAENGIVKPEDLEAAIRPDTAFATIMYANNEIGTLQPIQELGTICHKHDILFHTDAVQAVGHLPINLTTQPIDLLSFSAHKFHGPKGIGGLYARKGLQLTSLILGGPQERERRAGTENVPAIVGMAAALDESARQMQETSQKLLKLRNTLMQGLLSIPRSMLNGDPDLRLPSNVNVSFEGIEAETLLLLLDQHGICASSGSACTSGSINPSHVLLAIGRSPELASGSLRLTLSEENTMEEIEQIVQTTREAVSLLRK